MERRSERERESGQIRQAGQVLALEVDAGTDVPHVEWVIDHTFCAGRQRTGNELRVVIVRLVQLDVDEWAGPLTNKGLLPERKINSPICPLVNVPAQPATVQC